MRVLLLLVCVCAIGGKGAKALTESLGQEVIELGAPIKELGVELEEEPSAEKEETVTSTTVQLATKIDARRVMDQRDPKQDEEARIEKELAEIYKDSSDYKSDSNEVKEKPNSTETTLVIATTTETPADEKPIARMRANFKFQPNSNNAKEVENFRTSVDEINCPRDKLLASTPVPASAVLVTLDTILMIASSVLIL